MLSFCVIYFTAFCKKVCFPFQVIMQGNKLFKEVKYMVSLFV